jgi:hypothetical protein
VCGKVGGSVVKSFYAGLAAAVLLCGSSVARAGILIAEVHKSFGYRQVDATLVTENWPGMATVSVTLLPEVPGDFDSATYTLPGSSTPASMTKVGPGVAFFGPTPFTTPEAALDAAYPSGIYTFTASNAATSATQTVHVAYDQSLPPAAIPRIDADAYLALQHLNPTTGFTLHFNAFAPDPTVNFSETGLFIVDLTGGPYIQLVHEYLPASSTSFSFAANTFTAGHRYLGDLAFFQGFEGVEGDALTNGLVSRQTNFYFAVPDDVPLAVPEPGTWMMTLMGFGALGARIRTRRKALA